jgi:hypothetical protein
MAFFVVSGNHGSTFVRSVFAQRGMVFPGVEPTVPPIAPRIDTFKMNGGVQTLDGLDCHDCAFNGTTFEYSGGAFNLENTTISTPMRVNLKGAAANTQLMITIVESINRGVQPRAVPQQTPIPKAALAKQTVRVNLASPYGQK